MTLGGRTIREWQDAMSHHEFEMWQRYRWRHGPMGPERKYDRGAALVASVLAQLNGQRKTVKDMSPWPRVTQAESEMQALFDEITGGAD